VLASVAVDSRTPEVPLQWGENRSSTSTAELASLLVTALQSAQQSAAWLTRRSSSTRKTGGGRRTDPAAGSSRACCRFDARRSTSCARCRSYAGRFTSARRRPYAELTADPFADPFARRCLAGRFTARCRRFSAELLSARRCLAGRFTARCRQFSAELLSAVVARCRSLAGHSTSSLSGDSVRPRHSARHLGGEAWV